MFGSDPENQTAYQEPTYNTAIQVVTMLRILEETPGGELEVSKLAERLEVHPRTVKRYIEAIGGVLDGSGNKPYVERIRKGRSPFAKLNRPASQTMSLTLLNYAAVRLATASLTAVDPEGFGLLHEDVSGAVHDELAAKHLEALKNFEDAFLYVPYGPKRYDDQDSRVIQSILTAISKHNVVEIEYGDSGEPREVHPLAVVLYRDALYLYAKQVKPKAGPRTFRYFAIDRIENITIDHKKTYRRPADFDPNELGKNSLGIWDDGRPEYVHLRFTEDAARYVRERSWPNQISCEETGPDEVELEMKIPITPEVVTWLAGWGRKVEVLEPEDLIDRLRNHLADALDFYI